MYLLFDLEDIITRKDTQFSSGSLARENAQVFSSAEDFQVLLFNMIYHDTWFTPEEKDQIINHRQAEVIVPERVGLQSLRYIWCRSQAEKEVLRHFLPTQVLKRWRDRIVTSTNVHPFFRKWAYIEQATLTEESITFHFHQPAALTDQGPFVALAAC